VDERLMATLKGAFIKFETGRLAGRPTIVVFQFNPDRVTRAPTLADVPMKPHGSGRRGASQQPEGPSESISFTLQVDATDQRAERNAVAAASGILPMLSALEQLMVPRPPPIDLTRLSGRRRKAHRHPPEKLATVLFFWGPFRILPVSVKSLTITETEYDPLLTPVRAEVAVTLDVLTRSQLEGVALAIGAYKYSQGVKDVMAALHQMNAAGFGITARLSVPS
jgi:hypothetical protein